MSEKIGGEMKDQLIAHLRQHTIERDQVAQLYANLAVENTMHPGSGATIVCRKCGGEYLPDKHELVEAFGYIYHERCVPTENKDNKPEDEGDNQSRI